MISACERAGQWQLALHLLQLLKRSKLEMDVVSYGGVANVCAKARSWQFAVELSPGALGIFHLFLSLLLEWVKKAWKLKR